jgi:hypothetical protein
MLVRSEQRFSTRAQFIVEEQLRVSALRPTLVGECLDGRGFSASALASIAWELVGS